MKMIESIFGAIGTAGAATLNSFLVKFVALGGFEALCFTTAIAFALWAEQWFHRKRGEKMESFGCAFRATVEELFGNKRWMLGFMAAMMVTTASIAILKTPGGLLEYAVENLPRPGPWFASLWSYFRYGNFPPVATGKLPSLVLTPKATPDWFYWEATAAIVGLLSAFLLLLCAEELKKAGAEAKEVMEKRLRQRRAAHEAQVAATAKQAVPKTPPSTTTVTVVPATATTSGTPVTAPATTTITTSATASAPSPQAGTSAKWLTFFGAGMTGDIMAEGLMTLLHSFFRGLQRRSL